MIPLILANEARRTATSDTVDAAMTTATKESSAVIGIAGAIGALGGFLIPMTFGAPWIDDPVDSVQTAFVVFTAFYALCLATTWFFYTRRVTFAGRAPSLATANI
jgi:NNP family nitrate/nitrite transporter-like MFS transporter